mmetsp:Transcript_31619/g.69236  ORF Transcript_31619/g.69236 Transcript_31619/m.69236 type:complete len:1071 (-) Transcript_31619:108-3320(-)
MTAIAPEPEAAQDQFQQLRQCKIWEKLRTGQLHHITKENVQELVDVLDRDDAGDIATEDLRMLKQVPDIDLTDQDIKDLVKDCDKAGTGKTNVDDLYMALTQGSIAFSVLLDSLNKSGVKVKSNECDREDLLRWMHEEYNTASALWSLPQTVVLFVCFITAAINHLGIWAANRMQDSIHGAVTREGPYLLMEYVHDAPTFWDWMETSFANVYFKNDLANFPYPGRLESYQQIIGGVQMVKTDVMPGTCEQSAALASFYSTQGDDIGGHCHMNMEPVTESFVVLYHEKVEDIIESFRILRTNFWMNINTTKLDQITLFYNAHLGAFAACHLLFEMEPEPGMRDGNMNIRFSIETFLADPYHDKWLIAIDGLFIILMLKLLAGELMEFVPACQNGLEGVLDYLQIWHIIDWLVIIFGVVLISLWSMLCTKVSGDLQTTIAGLPSSGLDAAIRQNGTFEPVDLDNATSRMAFNAGVEGVHTLAEEIAGDHFRLRFLVFFYLMLLASKFFRAFRANPRLNVVIRTIIVARSDFAHFGIVFSVIFMMFASMGWVFWGKDMRVFSTLPRSMMACWRILMGADFVDEMELAGGTSMAWLWVFSFQLLVLVVLMHLLLAIIIDTYTEVKTMRVAPKPIWTQSREAIRTVRETRGHLDLWYLICEFEDEDYKAHPASRVTSRSLRRAFERDKMTRHNADYLIRKTNESLLERQDDCDLSLTDAVRIIGQVKTTVMKIDSQTDLAVEMLKAESLKPQDARFDAIMAGAEPDQPGFGLPPAAGFQPHPNQDAAHAMFGAHSHGADHGAGRQFGGFRNSHHQAMVVPGTVLPPGVQLNGQGGIPNNMSMNADGTARIQTTLDVIIAHLADQKRVADQRHAWLEQRFATTDRRCERIEKTVEQLKGTLAESFEEMANLMHAQHEIMSSGQFGHSEGSPTSKRSSTSAMMVHQEKSIDTLREQIAQLLAHAEDATESRKLLWRIDNRLRMATAGSTGGISGGSFGTPMQTGSPGVTASSWTRHMAPSQPSAGSEGRGEPEQFPRPEGAGTGAVRIGTPPTRLPSAASASQQQAALRARGVPGTS